MEVDGEGRRGLFHNVSSYEDNNLWDFGLMMTSLEIMSPHSSVSGDCEEAIV